MLQPDWKLAQGQRTGAGLEGLVQRASRVSGDARLGGYGSPCRADDFWPSMRGDMPLVEDLGAMNRWPERTSFDLKQYLERWQASCAEIGTPGHLPKRLEALLV